MKREPMHATYEERMAFKKERETALFECMAEILDWKHSRIMAPSLFRRSPKREKSLPIFVYLSLIYLLLIYIYLYIPCLSTYPLSVSSIYLPLIYISFHIQHGKA